MTMWWKRPRKTDHPIWHFMKECPSYPSATADFSKSEYTRFTNPRSGTKCDHCQRLSKGTVHEKS